MSLKLKWKEGEILNLEVEDEESVEEE